MWRFESRNRGRNYAPTESRLIALILSFLFIVSTVFNFSGAALLTGPMMGWRDDDGGDATTPTVEDCGG